MLDFSPLRIAIMRLEHHLAYTERANKASNEEAYEVGISASIHAFSHTYELSIKMIRRYLNMISGSPGYADQLTFNKLIREAYAKGLISQEITVWRTFREQRGTTSHTYDQLKAEDVFAGIPTFLNEALYLYVHLAAKTPEAE